MPKPCCFVVTPTSSIFRENIMYFHVWHLFVYLCILHNQEETCVPSPGGIGASELLSVFPKRVASPRLLLLRLKERIVLGGSKRPF